MNYLKHRVLQSLQAIKESNCFRSREVFGKATIPYCVIDGKQYISFASNDYLGLSQSEAVIVAGQKALGDYGAGSRSSAVVQGYGEQHAALENFLKSKTKRNGAIYFPNAFTANYTALTTLLDKKDKVYAHRDNHASLNQVLLRGHRHFKRFIDLDEVDMDLVLPSWIISDHIFSVSGKIAPIKKYIAIAKKNDLMLFIDDIHGLGVYGQQGFGLSDDYSEQDIPLISLGFGKALGCYGGALIGDESLIECIRQKAWSYIYSTSPPSVLPAMALSALETMLAEPWRREKLKNNIDYFIQEAIRLNINLVSFDSTPIFACLYPTIDAAQKVQARLKASGVALTLMRYPTVPREKGCLRFAMTAAHEESMLDILLAILAESNHESINHDLLLDNVS